MNINQKIVDMYNNPTYQELKDYYSKTTIFNVLGIERNERRHSAFLRWLFDNSSNHGLGEEPIKKFLRLYALHMQRGENDALNILLMAGNYDLEITEIVTEKAIKKYSKNSNGYVDILVRMNLTEIEENNNISVVLIIENKIDSGEGDNQTDDYHKYFEDTKESNEIPIEIYLTPEGAKGPNCKSFKHITYRELLKDVLLPLNRMVMPDEAKQIISDYIRNLSKPSVTENGKEYTVIATSEEESSKLKDIYNAFPDLYDAALIAGNMDQIIKTLGKVDNFREVVSFLNGLQLVDIASDNKKLTRDECIDLIQGMECRQLLEAFWNNNENLFKAILPQIEQMRIPVDRERIFKISHRDTSRYNVFAENKKYGQRLFKNRAANAIFRAYIEKHPDVKLEELNGIFPGHINMYYHDRLFQNLFYKASNTDPYFDAPKFNGIQVQGDINWDFLFEEQYLLKINNGTEKVMSVKMWRKDDFERLLKHILDNKELRFIKVELC